MSPTVDWEGREVTVSRVVPVRVATVFFSREEVEQLLAGEARSRTAMRSDLVDTRFSWRGEGLSEVYGVAVELAYEEAS